MRRGKRRGAWGILLLLICVMMLTAGCQKTSATPEAAGGKINNTTGILLVNAANPLPEDAEPKDLVNLYEMKRHFLLARSDIYLEREAFEAADRMFKQAEDENLNGFILTSGYRSREKQQELFETRQDDTVQAPGCSEHETGLAFDVTARSNTEGFETTPQFAWLSEHCWDYGFILRYPQGKESITGIVYEPWHYRYVGTEAAAVIHKNSWTLEEYCLLESK